MKIIYSLVFVFVLLVSCDTENVIIDKISSPKIVELSSSSLSIGDTIEIRGVNFLNSSLSRKIYLDPNITINSSDCIIWQSNRIQFVIPDTSITGIIRIQVGDTLSNSKNITISSVPNFQTVIIPAGNFQMGSENGFYNESPTHNVQITSAFEISTTEITQRLYKAIMKTNPSITKHLLLPVDSVSWLDAIKFCNKLSKLQNYDTCYRISGNDVTWIPNTNGWRLPTEAEWEFAARDTTKGDFGGNQNIDLMGWYSENSGMKSHPVASKSPNGYGLYDMHGNVWEWVWDWYDADYYKSSPNQNPKGPGSGSQKVLRGGAYSTGKNYLRSSNRSLPAVLGFNIGFRIVRNK